MPNDDDLFAEEHSMISMSFGEHIEELRYHLIFAIVGLAIGVIFTFIPPLSLGARVMRRMEEPARRALADINTELVEKKAREAEENKEITKPVIERIDAYDLVAGLRKLAPEANLPAPEKVKGKVIPVHIVRQRADQIRNISKEIIPRAPIITLGPMEAFTNYFMVCVVTGLVLSSPWVFYQLWAFVAAGLYRHERQYMYKFLPFAITLFLGGVALCFFAVLPVTLDFLLQFNVWLNIEPTMRITEWIRFATILPLVFGICFQTPLVMLMLERVGIFTADDFRSKRRIAILVMFVAAAIITPTQDPFSLALLAVPMVLLYELGLILIGNRKQVPSEVA